TVNRASASATITSSIAPAGTSAPYGQAVITAHVSDASTFTPPNNPVPGGGGIFHVRGGMTYDSPTPVPLVTRQADLPITLSPGSDTITFDYVPDANFQATSAAPFLQPVTRDNTDTTVATTNANAPFGSAVITATVRAHDAPVSQNAAIPTGSVT